MKAKTSMTIRRYDHCGVTIFQKSIWDEHCSFHKRHPQGLLPEKIIKQQPRDSALDGDVETSQIDSDVGRGQKGGCFVRSMRASYQRSSHARPAER